MGIEWTTVDKDIQGEDLRYERIDVVVGAVLTGVIGLFIVVARATTLLVTHTDVMGAHALGWAGRLATCPRVSM